MQSLSQIVGISRFANLRSRPVRARLPADPDGRRSDVQGVRRPLETLTSPATASRASRGCPCSETCARWTSPTTPSSPSTASTSAPCRAGCRSVQPVRSLHALTIPRADGQPWSLAHLDIRDNNVETFADLGAGLAAVVSLRADPPSRLARLFGSFNPSSELRTIADCPPRRRRRPTRSKPRRARLGRTRRPRDAAGNPVCLEPSYRLAIAKAPWLRELDGEPLSRGPDDWRRDPARSRTPGTRICWSAPRARRRRPRRPRRSRGPRRRRRARERGAEPEKEGTRKRRIRPLPPRKSLRRRSRRTTPPPRDGIERRREDGRGADPVQGQAHAGRSGRSPAKRDQRGDVCADDEILQALDDDG